MTEREPGIKKSQLVYVKPGDLHVHPQNPRKTYDADELKDLRASIAKKGIQTPLIARPHKDGLQVLCGSRRLKAALAEKFTEVPVLMREVEDAQALDVMIIDNLQREGIHPLEEAAAFRQLLKGSSDVAGLAASIGRSPRFVYDRLNLLQLTKSAADLFRCGKFELGQAILIARLNEEDQKRLIGTQHDPGPLFQHLSMLPWDQEPDGKDALVKYKPISVRELQAWIDKYVRLSIKEAPDAMLFPAAAQAVQAPDGDAVEQVVAITRLHQLPQGTKDDGRTYTPATWREAKKPCEKTLTGVVVVGPGRGDALQVCVDKKRCKVHWAAEIREAQKRTKDVATGKTTREKAAEERQRRYDREQEAREQARVLWSKGTPLVLQAMATNLMRMRSVTGLVTDVVVSSLNHGVTGQAHRGMVPRGKALEQILKHLCWLVLVNEAGKWDAPTSFPKLAKAFQVDTKKVLASLDKETPAKKA
jgi:ParB/RepB/Spo0J family partition protein